MSGIDDVGIERNADGLPITYQCDRVIDKNRKVEDVEVTFFYDLKFKRTVDSVSARQEFESNLLTLIANDYGFDTGSICRIQEQGLWIVKISSLPEDEQNLLFDQCFDLAPDQTESCISYEGHMSGSIIGSKETTELNNLIRDKISSGAVTAGTSMTASFLGFSIESDQYTGGRDSISPAVNTVDQKIDNSARRSKTITPIGAMLAVGLALGIVGIIFVIVRMRRRRAQLLREEVIMATTSREIDYGDQSGKALDSPRDVAYLDDGFSDGGPLASPPPQFENRYTFDVGNVMKAELMGRHANGSRRDMSGRALDESDLSESDVDSWAQTDATLGSIEHRLEPITAEV